MTIAPSPIVTRPYPARPVTKGTLLLQLLNTTDHKMIGKMYLVTSFVFFFAGGLMALLMRAELAAIHGLSGISPNLFEVTGKMLD